MSESRPEILPINTSASLGTESVLKIEPVDDIYAATMSHRIKGGSSVCWAILLVLSCTLVFVLTLWYQGVLVWPLQFVAAFVAVMGGGMLAAGVAGILKHRRNFRERSVLYEIFHASASQGRLVCDITHRTILYNDAFAALCADVLGDRAAAGNGLEALRRIFAATPESLERFEVMMELAYRGAMERAFLLTKVDGYVRWLKVDVHPVPGWVGTISWRIKDITAEYEKNLATNSERDKLIDFTDNAPVGFFSCDKDGRFLFVNATFARWIGADIDMLLSGGARLHHFMVEPPENAQPYDLTASGGVRQVAEVKMKGPHGSVFLAAINQSVVIEGEDVRTRAVVHDLTNEREMRQALKDSEDRFQRFFHEAPLGIAQIDKHGVLSDCNDALANMLGMKAESVEGRNFESLIADKDRERVVVATQAMEESRNLDAPLEITLKGADRDVVVQMHARRFSGRNMVLHFINLTEQKALEAQFTQSQKMQAVGQLAGGVAHDFNNLLTAMIGFCDLLLLRHKPGDPSFNDIMQIKQNANRAANLVRQLLAFSRQQTMQPKVLDVTETLTELSHLMRRLIGVMIDFDIFHETDNGLVKVDEGQLEQVLINLVVNARDAMDGQGHLTIKTQQITTDAPKQRGADTMPAGDWVVISVADTGCGISKENIARIFEPFFTTKAIGSGTGLGLSTVYGIVRQTGGYVHVDSVLGQGTTFSIYLPRQERSATVAGTKEKIEEKVTDLTGTATIMLVEDEDAVRAFSSRALTNKGYKVLDANGGEAALELVEAHGDTIDLIVTDVIMPDMDGPTMITKVRETYAELPVIFVSGYTEDKFKEQFGDNTYFLPKPFTLQQLAAKVKEVLDK